MRGWERVTPTDIARLGAKLARLSRVAAATAPAKSVGHKFHAEPCLVTTDGTLFTLVDIQHAEIARHPPQTPTGTLQERAARLGIFGRWFASTKEGRRYIELRALERARAISNLRCQVTYDLTVVSRVDSRAQTIGHYIADFVYRRVGETQDVIEDTKSTGTKTKFYRRARKHFEAEYGLPILET